METEKSIKGHYVIHFNASDKYDDRIDKILSLHEKTGLDADLFYVRNGKVIEMDPNNRRKERYNLLKSQKVIFFPTARSTYAPHKSYVLKIIKQHIYFTINLN